MDSQICQTYRAEALETIAESAGIVPVLCSNIAAVISGNASAVNDDSKDDEPEASCDLDDAQNELDCTIALVFQLRTESLALVVPSP